MCRPERPAIVKRSFPDFQEEVMDDFAMSILEKQPVRVPGEEGLKDMKVVEAIFRSADRGERVIVGK